MTAMRCATVENLLDLYAEGRLSPFWKRLVAAHLKTCPRCEREARALGALRRAPEAAARAPRELLKELESLETAARTARPLPPEPPLPKRRDYSVLAAVAVYAALLIACALTGPDVPSQKHANGSLWEVPR